MPTPAGASLGGNAGGGETLVLGNIPDPLLSSPIPAILAIELYRKRLHGKSDFIYRKSEPFSLVCTPFTRNYYYMKADKLPHCGCVPSPSHLQPSHKHCVSFDPDTLGIIVLLVFYDGRWADRSFQGEGL
jgi:hypothetical protein